MVHFSGCCQQLHAQLAKSHHAEASEHGARVCVASSNPALGRICSKQRRHDILPCKHGCQGVHMLTSGAMQEMDEELQSTHASNTELDQANGDLRNQLGSLRQEGHQSHHALRALTAQHRLAPHLPCSGLMHLCLLLPFMHRQTAVRCAACAEAIAGPSKWGGPTAPWLLYVTVC